MNLLRGCFSILTLASLSYGLGSDDSDCDFNLLLNSFLKEIRCRSGNSSSEISFWYENTNLNKKLVIQCYRTVNQSNYKNVRIMEKFSGPSFESCQPLESKQIDFIEQHLSFENTKELIFGGLNMDLAMNISKSILLDFENIEQLSLMRINSSAVFSDHLQEFKKNLSLHLSGSLQGKVSIGHLISRVSSLTLINNDLEVIDSNTFGESKVLHSLHIEEENLHRIMPNSFDKMVSLTSITIKCKQLQSLPGNLFANLRNLNFFKLTNNIYCRDMPTSKFSQNQSKFVHVSLCDIKQKLITLPNKFLANMTHLETVIMTRNGLVTLPEDLFFGSIELRYIDMQNNNIKSLPSLLFKDCEQILRIDFRKNQIRVLPDNIFSNQKNLSSLYLSQNQIRVLPNDIFSNQKNLSLIDLSYNQIEVLPNDIFSNQKNLSSLDLSNNQIQVLPNAIFLKQKNLDCLDLSNNQIQVLSNDTFSNQNNLDSLDLSNNKIYVLPDNIFSNQKNLSSIDLSNNQIQVLPVDSFSNQKNLESLNLSNNQIQVLPNDSFSNQKNLDSLDLSNNQIRVLPNAIFSNQENLNLLDLSNNHIDFLPKSIFLNQKNLSSIDLSNNQIEVLPDDIFSNQKNLSLIDLSNNQIQVLPNEIFLYQKYLKSLDLSNNQIQVLPYEIFLYQEYLELLDLSNNRIEVLPGGIFSNQKNLDSLDLSGNCITTISGSVFNGLKFQKLNMSENNLQIIENDFWVLRSRTIILSHNHLTLKNLSSTFRFHCDNLDLSYNHISHPINSRLFVSFDLRNLNLQHNNLENITDKDWNFPFYKLKIDMRFNKIKEITMTRNVDETNHGNIFIDVGNNPMDCDCKVHDFLAYLAKERYPSTESSLQLNVSSLKCQEPAFLKNTPLLSLKSETLRCLIKEPQTINATCPEKCECWKKLSNLVYIIDCSNRGFDRAPEKIKGPLEHQIELNLTGNFLTSIPSLSKPGYEKVTVLLLSHNKIDNVPFQPLLKNLRILELHDNKLTKIDTSVFNYLENSTYLTNLTLHNNLWECNCDQNEFWKFIQATRVKLVDLNDVTCGEMKQKFYLTSSDELCPNHFLIISCIAIPTFFGIIIAMYYRHQQEIKVWLYAKQWCLWWVSEDELDKDKIYDAFISYSHLDDDFVVNELIAKLEEGPTPCKLCVHFRDWFPGESIAMQVARSVENSKRTVIVLSANFIHSEWGKMEFRAAHSQALSEGRMRVIVIIYGEIPPLDDLDSELRAYLTMNTYVKWGDPWFWKKLRFALPHRS